MMYRTERHELILHSSLVTLHPSLLNSVAELEPTTKGPAPQHCC